MFFLEEDSVRHRGSCRSILKRQTISKVFEKILSLSHFAFDHLFSVVSGGGVIKAAAAVAAVSSRQSGRRQIS